MPKYLGYITVTTKYEIEVEAMTQKQAERLVAQEYEQSAIDYVSDSYVTSWDVEEMDEEEEEDEEDESF